jgi:hypothetical protein
MAVIQGFYKKVDSSELCYVIGIGVIQGEKVVITQFADAAYHVFHERDFSPVLFEPIERDSFIAQMKNSFDVKAPAIDWP